MRIPSLTGLRAFEAAARCQSFVKAGEELTVTSAAVSLQVKRLEEHLEKKLFERQGNRIFLTDAGMELFSSLTHAFGEISESVSRLRQERRPRQLIVSVIPSLADCWLVPRIADFGARNRAILDIRVQEDPIDFVKESADIRLTYQSTYYPNYLQKTLFSDVAKPVCSPAFWSQHCDSEGHLVNVPQSRLIQVNWGTAYANTPRWTDWFREAGRSFIQRQDSGLIVSDLSVAMTAARNGAGVALVPSRFAELSVLEGSLVEPSQISIAMAKPYVGVYPEARSDYAILRRFFEALGITS
ncbi:MAG: LysR family transcriptional regulator [Pseudomonadota bacterium]